MTPRSMSQIIRAVVTLGIWACVTFIMMSGADSVNAVWLALVFGIAAAASTIAIWASAAVESMAANDQAEQAASKSKRNSRVSRMVNNLNDDEVSELADLLIAREESRLTNERSYRLRE